MRPILLKISAFGPYADEKIIPMDELGDRGLYLITGDTGAGKTTIFDAICFALFGDASGDVRESSMFRSKYADPNTKTYVEMTFSHSGKEYRIERNPDYMRPKKSGVGETKETASATFYLPNGSVVTGVKDVNEAVIGLLGINRQQFSQIAMLAQGDFKKLLLADTKQRMEIFRKLFKTQYYQELQKRLIAEKTAVENECKSAKSSVDQYVRGILCDEDDVLAIEVDKAKSGSMTTESIMELLDKLIEQDKSSEEKLETELKAVNGEIEKVNQSIGKAETIIKNRRELEKAETGLADIKSQEKEIKDNYENCSKALEGKDELIAAQTKIKEQLPKFDEIASLESSISTAKKQLNTNQDSLDSKSATVEKAEKQLEANKTELETLKDAGADKEKYAAEAEKIQLKIDALVDIESAVKKIKVKKSALVSAQEKYAADNKTYLTAKAEFEAMDQAFRDGQAGILASTLTDGMPCPVCGSTSHPHKAELSTEVPTEVELEAAKEASEEARALADKSSKEAGNVKTELETMIEALKEKTRKQLDTEELSDIDTVLAEAKTAANNNLKAAEDKVKAEMSKMNRKKTLEENNKKLDTGIASYRNDITKLKEAIAAGKTKIDGDNNNVIKMKAELEFESKAAATSKYNALGNQVKALQDAFNKADERLKSYQTDVSRLTGAIKALKEALNGAESFDLDALNEKYTELSTKRTGINNSIKATGSRKDTNEGIKSNIGLKSKELEEKEKRLAWVKSLSDTANGSVSQKEKIMLETFIQRAYFDRIIDRANIRLSKMSSDQYELKRQEEASNNKNQSGLELSVIDHYNGTERSVKTLSGGESFLASLSLALGLSDEIQASAGGISVDTMFVDEGFGSLDADTLDMAYSALVGLSEGNKLVGIISHVAELKTKIDKQIIVTKEKSGGSFVKIQV